MEEKTIPTTQRSQPKPTRNQRRMLGNRSSSDERKARARSFRLGTSFADEMNQIALKRAKEMQSRFQEHITTLLRQKPNAGSEQSNPQTPTEVLPTNAK